MAKKDIYAIVSGAGWIGSFAGALVSELEELGVPFESIHRLNGNTDEGKKLVHVCAEKIAEMAKRKENEFVKLISGNESLILDPADGTETLADARDIFAYIDPDFKNWGTNQKGPATQATPVCVYEMIKDANFSQIFGSLSSDDVTKSYLAQAQIKGFVKKYRCWLRADGDATFFLFESNNHFFVADVRVLSVGRLEVYVSRFGNLHVWSAENRHRLVLPQLA